MPSEQLDSGGPIEAASDRSAVSQAAPSQASGADFPIVAVGASAGGLDSLERLFTQLPADTGMAFVVLQHLSPDFRSLMDELLSRRTPMRIRPAEHEMPVEPDTVYLLPPMKEMIIRQRRLLLSDRDPRHGLALPIDPFFRSLAQDAGQRAVAVILSGSGSDGSRGILEVSKAGGTVFCESPDTAQFNGMPLSAMRTGSVDRVLPPEEIAAALAALGRSGEQGAAERPSNEERGVDAILRLLRDEYGIDFSHYKAGTVTRRIERRLALNRSLDIDMYVEQLRSDPRELSSLYEDLLIGVTRFFRDEEAFEHRIIPELVERPIHRGRSGSGCRAVPRDRRRTRSRCCCTSAWTCGGAPSPSRFSRPTCTRRRSRSPAPACTARSRSPASPRSGCGASSRRGRTAIRSRRRCARASCSPRTT